MNKEFISYEQALALKELGFDEPTQRRLPSEQIGVPAYPFPTKGNE